MKKTLGWILGVLAALLLLALFFGGWVWSGGCCGWGGYYGRWGMHGGPGMMWGYAPFGWVGMGLGMLFLWLIPVGVIALVVYGIVALTKNAGNNTPVASFAPCPNCGKGTQADWQNCPYCGTKLK